jgi:hypothetical protein
MQQRGIKMIKKHCCPICGFDYGVRWIFIKTSNRLVRTGNKCKKCNAIITLEEENASYANKVKFFIPLANIFSALLLMPIYNTIKEFNYPPILSALSLLMLLFLFFLVYLFVFSVLVLKLFPKYFHKVGIISLLKHPQKIFPPVSW